jgi:hypothetical protein
MRLYFTSHVVSITKKGPWQRNSSELSSSARVRCGRWHYTPTLRPADRGHGRTGPGPPHATGVTKLRSTIEIHQSETAPLPMIGSGAVAGHRGQAPPWPDIPRPSWPCRPRHGTSRVRPLRRRSGGSSSAGKHPAGVLTSVQAVYFATSPSGFDFDRSSLIGKV